MQSFDHAMDGCNVCGNSAAPSLVLGMDPLTNTLVDVKEGVFRLRYITEITNDIISYCKELGKLIELRHFNGLKGNFEIIDAREYLATANLQEVKSLPHLICSKMSLKSLCSSIYVSDTLWCKAIPADLKIKQK